ncbi:MAG: hypothetical protein ACFFCS_04640 [Candidatus Hodarchaeota archaeon]
MKISTKSKTLILGFSILSVMLFSFASAAAITPQVVDVGMDNTSGGLGAGETNTWRFRMRTMITLQTQSALQFNMSVDAMNIGEKDVTIEFNSAEDAEMNMTCVEEQAELGLLNGQTIQTRNRNRLNFNYGFMANLTVNVTNFSAKLKAKVNDANTYVWAYYDENQQDWVTVPTSMINGEAIALVDHFSAWALLTVPFDPTATIITVSILGLLGVGVILLVRKYKKSH